MSVGYVVKKTNIDQGHNSTSNYMFFFQHDLALRQQQTSSLTAQQQQKKYTIFIKKSIKNMFKTNQILFFRGSYTSSFFYFLLSSYLYLNMHHNEMYLMSSLKPWTHNALLPEIRSLPQFIHHTNFCTSLGLFTDVITYCHV